MRKLHDTITEPDPILGFDEKVLAAILRRNGSHVWRAGDKYEIKSSWNLTMWTRHGQLMRFKKGDVLTYQGCKRQFGMPNTGTRDFVRIFDFGGIIVYSNSNCWLSEMEKIPWLKDDSITSI